MSFRVSVFCERFFPCVRAPISQNRNFLFWEILSIEVGCRNPKSEIAVSMKKPRFTKQYDRILARLREARVDAGFTQAEVGKRFGAHASFVSKCESGERRIDVVELAEFCKIYRVSLVDFLRSVGFE